MIKIEGEKQKILKLSCTRYVLLEDNDMLFIIDLFSNKMTILFPCLSMFLQRKAFIIEKIEIVNDLLVNDRTTSKMTKGKFASLVIGGYAISNIIGKIDKSLDIIFPRITTTLVLLAIFLIFIGRFVYVMINDRKDIKRRVLEDKTIIIRRKIKTWKSLELLFMGIAVYIFAIALLFSSVYSLFMIKTSVTAFLFCFMSLYIIIYFGLLALGNVNESEYEFPNIQHERLIQK